METTTSLTLDTVMTSQVDTTNINNRLTPAALQDLRCPPGDCVDVPLTTMTSFPVVETNTSVLDCQYQMDARLLAPVGMAILGVLGNVLALVVLYNTKTERRRSAFYTLVAGLALTDLLGQLLTAPLAIAAYGKGLNFSTNPNLCKLHGFLMVSFGLVTPLLVCLMALERIGALCCTYFCSRFLSTSRVRTALAGTWAFAMFFAALPLMGFGSYKPQYPCSWCFLQFHFQPSDAARIAERDLSSTLSSSTSAATRGVLSSSTSAATRGILDSSYAYACLYALINIIVIIITVVSNIVVIVVLLQARKRRRIMIPQPGTYPNYQHQSSPETVAKRGNGAAGAAQAVMPPGGRRDSQRVAQDLELQMVWLLCGMTLVFTCCWTPFTYQIIANVTSGVDSKPSQADVFLVRAAAMNQILDPWVYILLRRSLFRKIKSCLALTFRCRNSAGCGRESTTTGRGRVVSFVPQQKAEGGEERGEGGKTGGEWRKKLLGATNKEDRSQGIVHLPLIQQQQQQQQPELHPSSLHSVSGGRGSMHRTSSRGKPPSSTSPPPHSTCRKHGNSCNKCHGNCYRYNHDKINNNHHGNTYTDHHQASVYASERHLLVTANQEGDLIEANQESALISANEEAGGGGEEELPVVCHCTEQLEGRHGDEVHVADRESVSCNVGGDKVPVAGRESVSCNVGGDEVPVADRESVSCNVGGDKVPLAGRDSVSCTSPTSTYVTAESCIINNLDKEPSLSTTR